MSRYRLTNEDTGEILETNSLKDIENAVYGEKEFPIKLAVTILIILFVVLFILLMVMA